MKKIFLSMLTLMSAVTMSAQITADVTLRLESESHSVSELFLFAGPDLAASPERGGFFATQSNPEDINIYAVDPSTSGKYASYGNGTLVNIPVEIITSKEAAAKQNYTIKFEVYKDAEVLKLKDLVTGTETNITDGGSYGFTISSDPTSPNYTPGYTEGAYSVIANRFVINYDNTVFVTDVTTNAYGWASFSYDANLVAAYPAGLKIYKGSVAGDVLNLTKMDYVAANEGVIVYGTPNTTYYFAAGSGSSDFADNDLKPASAWASHTGSIFCLKGDALYEYVGSDMPANKAYLEISGSSAPKRISLRFNEEQGIEDVKTDVKAEKFVENGQIFIRRGNEVFNLQGQIVK